MSTTDPQTREEFDRILKERAEAYAKPLDEEAFVDVEYTVVVVGIGAELLGFPIEKLREIIRTPKITPLPNVPPHIIGLVQVRGELICAVDTASWWKVEGEGHQDFLVVVETPRGPLGLTVHRILGFREIQKREVADPLHASRPERSEFMKGITKDLVMLVDLNTIASSPDILVLGESSRAQRAQHGAQ